MSDSGHLIHLDNEIELCEKIMQFINKNLNVEGGIEKSEKTSISTDDE